MKILFLYLILTLALSTLLKNKFAYVSPGQSNFVCAASLS